MLTALPPAHQFCSAVIGILATGICELVDEADPSRKVLFKLAKGEETTIYHPSRAPLRVGFDTVLRAWWL